MNDSVKTLESITRNGDRYTARYEQVVEFKATFALPVYANALCNGNKVITRDRKLTTATKNRVEVNVVDIDVEEARALVEAAKATNMVKGFERFSDTEWIVRIK